MTGHGTLARSTIEQSAKWRAAIDVAIGGKADMPLFALLLAPERTSLVALHLSAFGGKADIFD